MLKTPEREYREACERDRMAAVVALFYKLSQFDIEHPDRLSERDSAIMDALGWALGNYDTKPRTDLE